MRLDGLWWMNVIAGPLNLLVFVWIGGIISLVLGILCTSFALYDYYMHLKENHG